MIAGYEISGASGDVDTGYDRAIRNLGQGN